MRFVNQICSERILVSGRASPSPHLRKEGNAADACERAYACGARFQRRISCGADKFRYPVHVGHGIANT